MEVQQADTTWLRRSFRFRKDGTLRFLRTQPRLLAVLEDVEPIIRDLYPVKARWLCQMPFPSYFYRLPAKTPSIQIFLQEMVTQDQRDTESERIWQTLEEVSDTRLRWMWQNTAEGHCVTFLPFHTSDFEEVDLEAAG